MKSFAGKDLPFREEYYRFEHEGRVFYNSLGHMPETFITPEIVGHFLAGLQFLLGDPAADATPNPVGRTSGQ